MNVCYLSTPVPTVNLLYHTNRRNKHGRLKQLPYNQISGLETKVPEPTNTATIFTMVSLVLSLPQSPLFMITIFSQIRKQKDTGQYLQSLR